MVTPIEELRRRLEEIRMRARERIRVLRPSGMSREIIGPKGIIGGGRVITEVQKRVSEVTAKVKERKPEIIPKVTEMISKWKPGERVKALLPSEAPSKAPEKEKSTLRGGEIRGTPPEVPSGALKLRK